VPLLEEFETIGNWFFRWRSYLPLLMLLLIPAGLAHFDYPLGSHFLDELWEIFCLALSGLGLAVRVVTTGFGATGTSGRQIKEQVAATLNSTGMYSIVRNPLYLGNFMIVLGVVIFIRVWWLALLYAAIFTLYYERIIFAEEMFLRRQFGREFVEWASKTPAFFPRFRQWKAPQLPFNWRKAVRREYHGVLAIALSMFSLELVGDLYAGYGFQIDALWSVILPVSVGFYTITRFLHKHTKTLDY
jgi:protein-S-isoprenylcysteine O-methyltransferase Ste14